MDWENKVKMIELGNAMNNIDGSKTEFHNYCLKHMLNFDAQAWSMFFDLVELIPDKMSKDFVFWRKSWKYIKDLDCNDEKFNFRASMRISLIQTIFKEDFNFTKNSF